MVENEIQTDTDQLLLSVIGEGGRKPPVGDALIPKFKV